MDTDPTHEQNHPPAVNTRRGQWRAARGAWCVPYPCLGALAVVGGGCAAVVRCVMYLHKHRVPTRGGVGGSHSGVRSHHHAHAAWDTSGTTHALHGGVGAVKVKLRGPRKKPFGRCVTTRSGEYPRASNTRWGRSRRWSATLLPTHTHAHSTGQGEGHPPNYVRMACAVLWCAVVCCAPQPRLKTAKHREASCALLYRPCS